MFEDHRLIEDYLPIEAISAEASREKSVRKGHISTLHLWWARRPLVACRAAVYGALMPASRFVPENEPEGERVSLGRDKAKKFVERLCKYPGDPRAIAEAQRHILEAHAERLSRETEKHITVEDIEAGRAPRPKVLDMFAGGGAIPLEALRLGCEAYALDLSPVAHIIELCTLVYPQQYGKPDPKAKGYAKNGTWAGLAEEVRYWGEWVLERVKTEIGDLYPSIPDPNYKRKDSSPGFPTCAQPGEGKDGGTGFPTCAQQGELFTSRRNLPHWQLQGSTYFVTFRLREGALTDNERDTVVNAIKHFHSERQQVVAAVVMPDHAHILLRPLPRPDGTDWPLGELLKSIKGFSAREINKSRDCTGPLWQEESFDRIVRDEAELMEKWGYIRNNPVKAGLVGMPEEYQWFWQPDAQPSQAGKPVLPSSAASSRYLTPVAYLWTRTVVCKNPACKATVPLVKQTWLCKKDGRYAALKVIAPKSERQVRFEVVEARSASDFGFDPEAGSKGGNATCPFCGTVADSQYVKADGCAGRMGRQMMAIACTRPGTKGKIYLSADDLPSHVPDHEAIRTRIGALCKRTGLTVPREPMPKPGTLGFRVQPYGVRTWGDLFTPRQMLCLLSFAATVREAEAAMEPLYEADRAKAVSTLLGVIVDRLTDFNSSLCVFNYTGGRGVKNTFSRQALPMVWDFAETNPFNLEGASWVSGIKDVPVALRDADIRITATVQRGSATALPWVGESFDAVITDPPYYDNVPYADISDFFYVWLRRTIGHLYPEHFASEGTPKKAEAVADATRHGGSKEKARRAYEEMMAQSFREAHRVLMPGGQMVVVYAHKTTLGWATLVEALRAAGFTVTESWPLDTEKPGRLRAQESAALASSILLIARKREGAEVGRYEDQVHPELEVIVRERVATLWDQGISGADLVIACVGAGLRAFTRFARVEYANGEEVPAERFLTEVETVVLDSILNRLSKETGTVGQTNLAGVDPPTRFYTLWRYTYRTAELEAGEAIIFANGTHVELDGPGGLSTGAKALIEKKKGKYRLRDYAGRGNDKRLGMPGDDGQPAPVIDALHRTLWLMENRPMDLAGFLREAQPNREQMRLVAQALAGPALKGGELADVSPTGELAALARLTANWRNVVEDQIMPLFGKKEGQQ